MNLLAYQWKQIVLIVFLFEHVAFGYSPEKLLMKDFNLNVKPGENGRNRGPNRCWENNLINLLERFMILVAAASNMMA